MLLINVIKKLLTGLDNSWRSFRFSPEGAIVFLTYRCTSKCKTCNIWRRSLNEDEEMSWSEWKPVFEKLADYGLKSIEFFGGDALLKKEVLLEMIRFCNESGIKTFFPTNSILLDNETAAQLVDAGLHTIYFSLDELPIINGQIRGVDNSFEKVNRAVQNIQKQRRGNKYPRMVCITTISRMNYAYIDKFLEYVNSIPFDSYTIRGLSEFNERDIPNSEVNGTLPTPFFMATGESSNLFSLDEASELLTKLHEIKSKTKRNNLIYVSMENLEMLTAEYLSTGTYPWMKCQFCTTQMIITPSANVAPCLYFTNYRLGNLREQPVAEIWGSKKHRFFYQQQKNKGIDICNCCGSKFYHKSFTDTIKAMFRKVIN